MLLFQSILNSEVIASLDFHRYRSILPVFELHIKWIHTVCILLCLSSLGHHSVSKSHYLVE